MMSPSDHDYQGEGYRQDDYDPNNYGQPAPSSRVGADLRAARERLGWTLPAIAQHLRIRLPYLAALEAGRTSELPGNAYAVGFVRTYATALGLDADEIGRRFRAEAAEVNKKTKLTFPAPVPERGVPAGAVVLLGVVVVVLAYGGWYRFSGDRSPAVEQVQAVPERLAPLAVPNAPPPAPVVPQQIVIAPQPVAPPIPAAPVLAPPAADGGRMVVRAKAEAWVQVRDKPGTVVFNRTMRAGETWPVPNKPGLLLTVGNAGGTEVLVDGIAAPSLGADGLVRRDIPLDADQMRDGKLAVPPPNAAKLPAKQP